MKMLHQLALSAVMSAVLIFAASEADAQSRVVNGGWSGPPRHHGGDLRGGHGFGGFAFPGYVVEREVVHVIEREVVVPVEPTPPEPAPPPPEPWVLGKTYASLPPHGCSVKWAFTRLEG